MDIDIHLQQGQGHTQGQCYFSQNTAISPNIVCLILYFGNTQMSHIVYVHLLINIFYIIQKIWTL